MGADKKQKGNTAEDEEAEGEEEVQEGSEEVYKDEL